MANKYSRGSGLPSSIVDGRFVGQKHHLIPVAAVSSSAGTRQALDRAYANVSGDFNINDASNGIYLPVSIADALTYNKARH